MPSEKSGDRVGQVISAVQDVREWAAGCSTMQDQKRHDAKKEGNELAAQRYQGRAETYEVVEQQLVEKVMSQFVAADGGPDAESVDRPDPKDDPFACSICGCYIGQFAGDYCDGCKRDVGIEPPMRQCVDCGQRGPEEQMNPIDVSGPEEYYPEFEYLCRGCSGGDD